jgi:hypothetical protein
MAYSADASKSFFPEGFDRELLLAALEDAGALSGPGRIVLDHLRTDPTYCGIRLVIARKPALQRQAEAASTGVLRIPLTGRWALKEVPEGLAGDSLDEALGSLMQPAECVLTLSLSDVGEVTPSWSEVGDLLSGLRAGASRVVELERQLLQASARVSLESRLVEALGGEDELDLTGDGNRTLSILGDIWRIKGAGGSTAGDVAQLTSNLRSGRTGVVFEESRRLKATIFAEYFCGLRSCYAIVWSAGTRNASTQEGPILLRLCPSGAVVDASTTGGSPELGRELIGSILAAVPEAKRADTLGPFDGTLALVLAVDEPMSLVNIDELVFEPVEVMLKLTRPEEGGLPNASFDSLSALSDNTEGLMCDYRLVPALTLPRSPYQGVAGDEDLGAKQWVFERLDEARRGTP